MRNYVYGILMIVAVLLTACTADDVTTKDTAQTTVPISFNCSVDNDPNAPYSTRAGHTGIMDTEDLYTTGFGVFAYQQPDGRPDLMYNQEVTFTFVGDLANPAKGFWSYQPLKFWPSDVANAYFCAYAPYVASATDDGSCGIIGMSDAAATTPYVDYRRPLHPETCVDLLWHYVNPTEIETLQLKMHHALARLRVSIELDDESTLPAGAKVLVKRITLMGRMAETGRLTLNTQTTETEGGKTLCFPVWSDQTYEDPRTIWIDHDPKSEGADADKYYGIVDSQIRYIEDMPYAWQPPGLQKGTALNALTTTDRQTYVYLIPQEALNVGCRVDYCIVETDGTTTEGLRRTATGADKRIPDAPATLRGNTTYDLKLKIKIS